MANLTHKFIYTSKISSLFSPAISWAKSPHYSLDTSHVFPRYSFTAGNPYCPKCLISCWPGDSTMATFGVPLLAHPPVSSASILDVPLAPGDVPLLARSPPSRAHKKSRSHCLSNCDWSLPVLGQHCTALYCTEVHCTVVHCNVLHRGGLHCTALRCTALYCIVLH